MEHEDESSFWLDAVLPWLAAVLGAATILLAALGIYAAVATKSLPQPPLLTTECPPFLDAGVDPLMPPPAAVADTHKALVPDREPKEALLCYYPSTLSSQTHLPLAGKGTKLKGDLGRIVAQLNKAPEQDKAAAACSSASVPAGYLLLLNYGDGAGIWVGTQVASSKCYLTSNGSFTTGVALADAFATAQKTGEWPS